METQQATVQDFKTLLGKMEVVRKEVNETLSNYYEDSSENTILKDDFVDLEIGERIFFNSSPENYAELVSIGIDKLVFIVINEKGSTIHKHKHDFYEEMRIIKGKLWESVANRIYVKEDKIKIRPFQLHGFEAKECSIYTVVIKLL